MHTKDLLGSIDKKDAEAIQVLLKEYVKPLTILTNFILTRNYKNRVGENEFTTVINAAKYDGVLDFMYSLTECAEELIEQ